MEEVSSDEINLRKLLSRRIDIFPNDPLVGLAQIRNNFNQQEIESITFHPRKFEQTTLHLLISKNSPNADQRLSAFNNGLSKLKKSGKMQKILSELQSGNYDGGKN